MTEDKRQGEDRRVKALSSLIQLEEEARGAETHRDLAYVFTNDIQRLLPARLVVFWQFGDGGSPELRSASNISAPDRNAPAVRALDALLGELLESHTVNDEPLEVDPEKLGERTRATVEELLTPWLLLVPLRRRNGALLGVILLAGDERWSELHHTLAGVLSDTFAHAWQALEKPERSRAIRAHLRRTWKRYLAAVVILLVLPVRQYVLAPAEVIPRDPQVVAAPMEGVVENVLVEPNARVEEGELLFVMDDTELRNRLSVARKALDVAQAEYLRNAQQAFACEDCRGKIAELKAVMERERAKVAWAEAQLEQSRVRAPRDGVAVFANANEWEGRPVTTGEKVMTVANPNESRLRILLPVGDAIETQPGAKVRFYPNVSPMSSYDAELLHGSYEARVQPDQTLAFEVVARLEGQQPPLGWRGTGKIYGDRAPLAYLVLRKPLSWLRRTLGI